MISFGYQLECTLPKELCNYEEGGWGNYCSAPKDIPGLEGWKQQGSPFVTTSRQGYRGAVILSPIFEDKEGEAEKIKAGIEKLNRIGAKINSSCYSKVLVDVGTTLQFDGLQRALGLFRKYEGAFYGAMGNRHFMESPYCQSIAQYKTLEGLEGGLLRSPYHWLFLHLPGILGFRFSGSLDSKKILAWTQLIKGTIEKAGAMGDMPWEIAEGTPSQQMDELQYLIAWTENGQYRGRLNGTDMEEARTEINRLVSKYEIGR